MLDGDGQADGEGSRLLEVLLYEAADLLGDGADFKDVEHREDAWCHGAVLGGAVLAVAEKPVIDGERRRVRLAAARVLLAGPGEVREAVLVTRVSEQLALPAVRSSVMCVDETCLLMATRCRTSTRSSRLVAQSRWSVCASRLMK